MVSTVTQTIASRTEGYHYPLQAQSLWERVEAIQKGRSNHLDNAIFERWRQRVALGKTSTFHRRLRLGNFGDLEASTARPLGLPLSFDLGLPLRSLTSSARVSHQPDTMTHGAGQTFLTEQALRTEQLKVLLAKLAGEASEKLLSAMSDLEGVSQEGLVSATAALSHRLMSITWQILVHEFKKYTLRASAGSIVPDINLFSDERLSALAGEFLEAMRSLPMETLRNHYPVWGRLRDLELNRWYSQTVCLLQRLKEDREVLSVAFGISANDLLISVSGSGDTHRNGRSVQVLTFQSGKKLVYKPRSGSVDVWYRELLLWISDQPGISLHLDAPMVVDKDEYTWIEFISHEKSNDLEGERRFYQRMGMLLALWGVCGGSDGHYENVIARGEMPYVVDTETLFDGHGLGAKRGAERTGSHVAAERLNNSVKKVGFMPNYIKPNEGIDPFDMSAIGLRAAIPAPFYGNDVEQRMCALLGIMGSSQEELTPQGNVPRERPEALGSDLIAAIEAGYSELYDLLRHRNRQIARRIRRLAGSPRARVRIVARQTHLYSRLLSESLKPEYLKDGAQRSIEIDRLSMKFTERRSSRLDGEMLAAEIHAMENLDIPLFDVPLGSSRGVRVTCDLEGRISGQRFGSPAQTAISHLRRMSPEDKAFQIRLIRETLLMDDALRGNRGASMGQEVVTNLPHNAPNVDQVWSHVREIEEIISTTAFSGSDKSLGWIAPIPLSNTGHYQHQSVGEGTYAGASGIALFYAALFKVTNDPAYRSKALCSLSSLVTAMKRSKRRSSAMVAHHLREIYSLMLCAKLLDEKSLTEVVDAVLNSATRRTFAHDTTFDVIGGSAGAILSLLSVWKETGQELPLTIAGQAGDHLLKNRCTTPVGLRAWETLRAPLGGFAHGVAGISLALERLSSATGNSRYRDASLEALAYERTLYDPAHGNWADLRPTATGAAPTYLPSAWCHGATGIGMAYLGISEVRNDTAITESISLARQATVTLPSLPSDTVCCGMFSRAAFMDLLSRRCGDVEAALIRDHIINEYMIRGPRHSRLIEGVPDFIQSVGFFNGLAGIGYELVRIYLDSSLPVVMMWE